MQFGQLKRREFVTLPRRRGADAFRMVAAHHDSPTYDAARMRDPTRPQGRLAITKQVVEVADIRTVLSRDHPFVAPGVPARRQT